MNGKKLLVPIILLALCAIGLFLLAVICFGTTDDFAFGRALGAWKTNPSGSTAAALEAAESHARTKTRIFHAVVWILLISDGFAILKVTRQVRKQGKNG